MGFITGSEVGIGGLLHQNYRQPNLQGLQQQAGLGFGQSQRIYGITGGGYFIPPCPIFRGVSRENGRSYEKFSFGVREFIKTFKRKEELENEWINRRFKKIFK